LTINSTLVNIYSAFFEAYPKVSKNSIGISHGVAWDSPSYVFNSGEQFWSRDKRFIESARLVDTLVSVDTNTASWLQTIDFNVGMKTKFIPNYVDTNEFSPRADFDKPRDKKIILFPRRLYAARGYNLMLDVIDEILENHSEVEFHFVGRGTLKDTDKIVEKQKKWGKRLQWYYRSMEEMPLVYKMADISVIPTINSEGTSLSCLEAMASGNAVIVTRVGGLPNLVINNFNGLMVNPNALEIKNAIEELLNNNEKLNSLKRNALNISKSFSKSQWEEQWKNIIEPMIDTKKIRKPEKSQLVLVNLWDIDSFYSPSTQKILKDLLINNALLYVKIKKPHEEESFGRIQFLDWDDEILNHVDLIVYDKNFADFYDEKSDLII